MNSTRNGLSLLEVILTLAILVMSVALLSQISKQSADDGIRSQRLATAQMLCESKMSEVLAGAIPLTTGSWTEITDSTFKKTWYYQIQTSAAERPNMIGVRLSVTDDPNATSENAELFFVVRWMIDPNLGLDTLPTTDATGATTGTTGTGTTGTSTGAGGVQ